MKILYIMLVLSVFMVSCQKKQYSDVKVLLGTVISINLIQGGNEKLIADAFSQIQKIEEMMSVSTDDYTSTVLLDINTRSDNALLNSSNTIMDYNSKEYRREYIVPQELAEVIESGILVAKLTEGAFDPTIAPLVHLWGFNAGQPRIPSQEEIDKVLPRVHWQSMSIKDNVLSLGIGQSLDVGAIAKGYVVDRTKKYLQDNGVSVAILDFGGNILVFGEKKNKELWNIGIQEPYNPGAYVLVLESKEASIVTSGVYERYFEVNETEYFHLISPFTGYPANNALLSVTVVHKESILADAFATAIFVMGLDKGLEFIEKTDDIEAIFITRNKEIIVSSGLKKHVRLANDMYTIRE